QRLHAKKAEFYEGRQVSVVEDNGTRMRATLLLADLHGKRKADIDVNLHRDDDLSVYFEDDPDGS
ncbi:MAG TPA: hypothetical protein VN437_08670, partial [Rectinemataceae bacterium]|nr:hypothetical protein [Rectinemataceae bacterium]